MTRVKQYNGLASYAESFFLMYDHLSIFTSPIAPGVS